MDGERKETKEEKAARRAAKAERKAEKAERKAAKAERKVAKGAKEESASQPAAAESKKRRRSVDADDSASAKPTKTVRESVATAVPSRPRTRSTDSLADALAKPSPPAKAPSRPRTRSTDYAELAAPSPSPPASAAGGSALSAAAFMAEHGLTVKGPAGFVCPPPMAAFAETPFPATLLAKCTAAGFGAPTVTQALSWPIALTGANLVSVAKTGSGKTLGYLLPAFHGLLTAHGGKPPPAPAGGYIEAGKPSILVLAPTRELACQIEGEATKFGRAVGLRSTCVYGGAPKSFQIRALRSGVEVVIGTPGRLLDLVQARCLALGAVRWLVLDEADRMLDMGFEEDVRSIVSATPRTRQTLLFTATWPTAVQRLAEEFAPSMVRLTLGSTDVLAANKSITQNVTVVSGGEAEKKDLLVALYKRLFMDAPAAPATAGGAAGAPKEKVKAGHGKSIVFVKFKQNCNELAQVLWDLGFSVDTLHGDMDQNTRTRVIGDFKAGKLRVLVATDVAARGLDVKDVTDVVNFDFPFGRNGVEDYVHRIGRTGRAGTTGTSHTFFDPAEDRKNAAGLIALLKGAGQPVPDALAALVRGGGGGGGKGRFGGGGGGFRGGGGGFRGGRGGGGGGGFYGRR